MTLADRLNKIISDKKITKREFASRLGVTENYIYILTGNSRAGTNQNKAISPLLSKSIAMEFGYNVDWILNGENYES